MSDTGHTASLGPSSTPETDMGMVQQVFDKAANAIVQASQLAIQVRELSTQVDALKRDIEYVRTKNQELDVQLSDVRRQRDNAEVELGTARTELGNLNSRVESLKTDNDYMARQIESLKADLERTKKDRDDAEFKNLDYEDRLKASEAQLEHIKDFARALVKEDTPAPVPTPVVEAYQPPPVLPTPEPVTTGEPWNAVRTW